MQTLPVYSGRFAAVLSNLTSGNVPYKQRHEFYSLITESLRPGGMFCDKLLSYPIPHENLDALLEKYENAPLNLDTVNRFKCEVFFCSDLLTEVGRCSDLLTEVGRVDTSLFYDHLRQMSPRPTVGAILDRLPLVTPRGMTWDYGRPWHREQEEFDLRLHCSDDRLERGDSPYANRLRCLRWDKPRCAR